MATLEDQMGLTGAGQPDDPFAALTAPQTPAASDPSVMSTIPLVTAMQILDQPVSPPIDQQQYAQAQSGQEPNFFRDVMNQLQSQQAASYSSATGAEQAQADAASQPAADASGLETIDVAPTTTQDTSQLSDTGLDTIDTAPAPDVQPATPTAAPTPTVQPAQPGPNDFVTDPDTGLSIRKSDLDAKQQKDDGGGGWLDKIGHAITKSTIGVGTDIDNLIAGAGDKLGSVLEAVPIPGSGAVGDRVRNISRIPKVADQGFMDEFKQETGEDLTPWTGVKAIDQRGFVPINERMVQATDYGTGHTLDPIVNQTIGDLSPPVAQYLTAAIDRGGEMAPYILLDALTGGAAAVPEGAGIGARAMAYLAGSPAIGIFSAHTAAGLGELTEAYRNNQITGAQFLEEAGTNIAGQLAPLMLGHLAIDPITRRLSSRRTAAGLHAEVQGELAKFRQMSPEEQQAFIQKNVDSITAADNVPTPAETAAQADAAVAANPGLSQDEALQYIQKMATRPPTEDQSVWYHGMNSTGEVHEIALHDGVNIIKEEDAANPAVARAFMSAVARRTADMGGLQDISPTTRATFEDARHNPTGYTNGDILDAAQEALGELGVNSAKSGDILRMAMLEAGIHGYEFPANTVFGAIDPMTQAPYEGRNLVMYTGRYDSAKMPFDETKLGTGEGSNYKGAGVYLTSNPRIAGHYAGHQFSGDGTITGLNPKGLRRVPLSGDFHNVPEFAAAMETQPGKVAMGWDPRAGAILRKNLYSGDLLQISTKEMVQNAVDAVRDMGGDGRVQVELNPENRSVAVSDNGPGMTPDVVKKELTDVGASLKGEGSSGGLGIAKVAIFGNAKNLLVTTIAKVGNKYLKTTMSGNGEDFMDATKGLNVATSEVLPGATGAPRTGTSISVQLYDDVQASPWAANGWLQNFHRSHMLPTQFDLSSTHRGATDNVADLVTRSPWQPLDTIHIRDANGNDTGSVMEIHGSPNTRPSSYVSSHVLNNGLPQYEKTQYLPQELPVPDGIVVNVKTKPGMTPEDDNYPWRPDREGLRDWAQQSFDNWVKGTLVTKGAEAQRNELSAVFDGALDIHPSGLTSPFKLVDTTGALPDALKDKLAGSQYLYDINEQLNPIFNAFNTVAERFFPGRRETDFYGTGLGDKYLGIDVRLANVYGRSNGEVPDAIMLNPYTIMHEIDAKVADGTIAPEMRTQYLAAHMVGTMLHEVAHSAASGHTEDFAGVLTRLLGNASTLIYQSTQNLGAALKEMEADGRLAQYDSDATALQREYSTGTLRNIVERASDSFEPEASRRRSAGLSPSVQGEQGGLAHDIPQRGAPETEVASGLAPGTESPRSEARVAEQTALDQFLRDHPATGQVPARQPYLPTRDEAYAATLDDHGGPRSTLIPNQESVQQAIENGRRLGYRDEDIAAYLKRNYVDLPQSEGRAFPGYTQFRWPIDRNIMEVETKDLDRVLTHQGLTRDDIDILSETPLHRPDPLSEATDTSSAPPVAGGDRIISKPESIDKLISAAPDQKRLGQIIRRVPVFGDAVRVLLGGSADRSTPVAAALAGYSKARFQFGNINEQAMARIREALPDNVFGDMVVDKGVEPNQYHLQLQRNDGSLAVEPINDILQSDLSEYNLTPEQRNSLLNLKQVVTDRADDLRTVMERLKKTGFDIKLLPPELEADLADQSDPSYFPRKPIGRRNSDGSITYMDGNFDRGTTTGGIRAGASFLGHRAGVGEFELPDGTQIQVGKGDKVVALPEGGYGVMTADEIKEFKRDNPGQPLGPMLGPDELKPLMQLPNGELRGVGKNEQVFQHPHTGEYEVHPNLDAFSAAHPEVDPGMLGGMDPVDLIDRSHHVYTTAEMEAQGWVYMKPEEALASWLNETGKRTADYEMLAKILEDNKKAILPREAIVPPGTTGVHPVQPAEKFGLGPEVTQRESGTTRMWQGERTPENINVAQFTKIPALSGYYGPKDLVKVLEDAFGTKASPPAILNAAQTVNDTLRGVAASTHIGTVGLQLLGALTHDMAGISRAGLRTAKGDLTGARASLSHTFATSWYNGMKSIFQGRDVMDDILRDPKNAGLFERWKSILNPPHEIEYWPQGVPGQRQPLMYRVPLAGAAFKRIGVSFDTAMYSAQVEMARSLDAIYPEATAAQREALGSFVRNSVGALSNSRLGVSSTQSATERFLMFSPRFTKSTFAMLYGAMKNDVGGEQTRLALASMIGAGAIAYAATAAELGQTPQWDPSKPGFLSVRVGDNWVGIGGAVRSMGHLLGTSGETLFQNPKAFLNVNPTDPQAWRDNPILNYWRGKASPLSGEAVDLVSGTDFRGTPINGVGDYVKLLAESGIPIAGKGAVEANGGAVSKAGMGILTDLGLHATPLTAYQMYDQYLRSQVDPRTGVQRFPDGANTANTADYLSFTRDNPEAAHLKQGVADARLGGSEQQQGIQTAINDRASRIEQAQSQFNTDHNYVSFRRAVTKIRADTANQLKQMNLSNISSTPDKKLVSSWYDLYRDPNVVNPTTGDINYDVLDKFQAQWKAAYPGQYEKLIQPTEEMGITPTETQLKKDRALIGSSGWWGTDADAWRTIMSRDTAGRAHGQTSPAAYENYMRDFYRQKAIAAGKPDPDAVASILVTNDPLVKYFHTLRTALRNKVLARTPGLLETLTRWGYASASPQRRSISALPQQ